MKILAIETSCDDTSVAIFRDDNLLSMSTKSQIKIHNETGGVVPEIAAREHANAIFITIDEVIKKSGVRLEELDYIAVTVEPGLMPSLLTGITVAETFGCILDIPVIEINHIEAHIFSNYLERQKNDIKYPLVCLTVSGGHNDIYYMTDMLHIEKIGSTGDDAGGEAFDKVAKMMGLGYPGGPIVSQLAKEYIDNHSDMFNKNSSLFPRVWLDREKFDFSFSGLKSAVKREIDKRLDSYNLQDTSNFPLIKGSSGIPNNLQNNDKIGLTLEDKREISYEFQNAITEVLAHKLINAAIQKKVQTVMLAGGVSANDNLNNLINNLARENNMNFIYPVKKLYCMDNAAMIGINGYYKIKAELEFNYT